MSNDYPETVIEIFDPEMRFRPAILQHENQGVEHMSEEEKTPQEILVEAALELASTDDLLGELQKRSDRARGYTIDQLIIAGKALALELEKILFSEWPIEGLGLERCHIQWTRL